jgi:hypothetical protein
VSAYRSLPAEPNPRVFFGNRTRAILQAIAGVCLVLATAAVVAAWARWGGGINGSVFLPAFAGLALVARARWGGVELDRARRTLLVTTFWLGLTKRHEIPLSEIGGIQVRAASMRKKDPSFDLLLVRTDERTIRLRRAGTAGALEADRVVLDDFFRDHDLHWGGAEARAAVRVADPAAPPPGEQETDGLQAEEQAGKVARR